MYMHMYMYMHMCMHMYMHMHMYMYMLHVGRVVGRGDQASLAPPHTPPQHD